MSTNLNLKGKVSTKTKKMLKNYDIIESTVGNNVYNSNKITIKKKDDGYFIYHMYDQIKSNDVKGYSGRWYNVNADILNLLDKQHLMLRYVIPEYDEHDSNGNLVITKNAQVKICFTSKGFNKLLKMVS